MPEGKDMRYVIAYDIEDDRVRDRIADLLAGYGPRVQKSVFECELDGQDLDRLTRRLKAELEREPGGHVRLYRLCAGCLAVSLSVGEAPESPADRPWIVV
jgi:CRISPR-associated protein Cas2